MSGRRRRLILLLVLPALSLALGCATSRPPGARRGYEEVGLASWYGPGFHGRRTANGEIYDMNAMTAAHKTLPFDLMVEVRNLDNGRRTLVRINDRGPFVRGRIIDLSRAAAADLGILRPGTARVRIRVVSGREPPAPKGYLVQLGAFQDRERARAMARRVGNDYSGVRVRSEGSWHRVVIGPFEKRRKAEKLVYRLERDGFEAFLRAAA